MSTHDRWELQSMQAAPLSVKVSLTKQRIREWVNAWGLDGVYVSFSGGKDSTVLLHIAREMYPEIKAVFINTGLEYPEIVQFVKTFDNVDIIRPKMSFRQVIEKYGYPFISKEVSECVYGARKYLTAVLAEQNAVDRQTDRQTDSVCVQAGSVVRNWRISESQKELADDKSIRILRGGGTTESIENSEDSQNSVQVRIRKTHRNREIQEENEDYPCSSKRVWKAIQFCKIWGVEEQETLLISPESERLTEALIRDSGKAIDNLRIQRLMGINRLDGKATMETIPDDVKDRSAFSCARYQFFLDAPFEISNQCCNVMKKRPSAKYTKETGRHPITAQMASESRLRTQVWLKHGCNAFDAKKPVSNPMSFWTEQDVLLYVKRYGIPICSVYGDIVEDVPDGEVEGQLTFSDMEGFEDMELFDAKLPAFRTTGCQRTGCVFCGYGCHHDKSPSRFERLHETHPKLYDYIMRPWEEGGLNYKEIIDWINEHGDLHIKY